VEYIEKGIEVIRGLIDVNNHYGPLAANTAAEALNGGPERSQRVFSLRRAEVGDDEWIGSLPNG
jgi:hypothetical protein